jgi:hypothetical protein
LAFFYDHKIFTTVVDDAEKPPKVNFDAAIMTDKTLKIVFNYKIEDGQVVKKASHEIESDYIVT